MDKLKLILAVFFLFVGIGCTIFTFSLSNKNSFGRVEYPTGRVRLNSTAAGTGIDSSNDGVAIGLGIISGFSFLSSTLLLTSTKKRTEL